MSHGEFERAYWGDCTNTFDEEQKHYVYAELMGITRSHFSFDVRGARVLDIGGGPVSMLLKASNLGASMVIDPLMNSYPEWVRQRYATKGISALSMKGEDIRGEPPYALDEVWIYNVLQHVEDPAKIIGNARAVARKVRLVEWIDVPAHEGHPHELTQAALDEWSGWKGRTKTLAERGCFGTVYFSVFRGAV